MQFACKLKGRCCCSFHPFCQFRLALLLIDEGRGHEVRWKGTVRRVLRGWTRVSQSLCSQYVSQGPLSAFCGFEAPRVSRNKNAFIVSRSYGGHTCIGNITRKPHKCCRATDENDLPDLAALDSIVCSLRRFVVLGPDFKHHLCWVCAGQVVVSHTTFQVIGANIYKEPGLVLVPPAIQYKESASWGCDLKAASIWSFKLIMVYSIRAVGVYWEVEPAEHQPVQAQLR